jgi:hypothetical protein
MKVSSIGVLFIAGLILSSLILIKVEASTNVIEIQPTSIKASSRYTKKSLRGLNRAHKKGILRQGIINLSGINNESSSSSSSQQMKTKPPDSFKIQFFPDGPAMIMQKKFEWDDDKGYFWYGENELHDSTMSFQAHGSNYTGLATISGIVYSFMTTPDGIILVDEVDVGSLPHESPHEKDVSNAQRDDEKHQDINRYLSDESLSMDSGETIDILCLYTRQALVGLCNDSQGHGCDDNYLDYRDEMDDKCQFLVHQTVSNYQINFLCALNKVKIYQLFFINDHDEIEFNIYFK